MGFGSEVHDGVALGDQVCDQRLVGDVAVNEPDPAREGVQRLRATGVGHGVQHRDLDVGAIADGAVDEVRADESRATGD